MDLSCIILSGDLELYVLGMLPEDEAAKIEQLAALFPEVQAELDRISESLEVMASAFEAAPSPSVKNSLMSQLRSLKEAEEADTTPSQHNKELHQEETPVISINKNRGGTSWWLAASTIGFIVCLGIAVYFGSISQQKNNEIASLQNRVNSLNKNYQNQQQQLAAYAATMRVMQDKNFKKIDLENLPGKQAGFAQVYWNSKTSEVFFSDISLPALPSGRQYQLWAIVDGKPVDAGLVNRSERVAQKMKEFEKAEAFAISIEKAGGNPTPTEVYLMGKA